MRVITIAAGAVVIEAAAGADEALASLATLRDAATLCNCSSEGIPCNSDAGDGGKPV